MTPPKSDPIHPSLVARKIIHFDMDCFYAAVEVRDNPELRGKPVIVGGKPGTRGVVATCSYEARKFGIHSAMSSSQAYKRCPEAIFVGTNFEKYRAVSSQIREIFKRYTPIIEPLSLDEAYLDVTGHELYATEIAKRVRAEIFKETALTCSAGVGANKLIAKIASDMNKPDGLTVVTPAQSERFMGALALRKIPGVGAVTEKKLSAWGFNRCSDIWPLELAELERQLGRRMATWLYARSRGIDERPVKTERIRKSLSAERTFSEDIHRLAPLKEAIHVICQKVSASLIKKQLKGRTVTLKVKYDDFQQITRSLSVGQYTNDGVAIYELACQLLQKTEVGERAVRLVGVCVGSFESGGDAAGETGVTAIQQQLISRFTWISLIML